MNPMCGQLSLNLFGNQACRPFTMESPSDVAARFDKISARYDETRQQLTKEALDQVAAILRKDGAKSILDAGVGTGRVAIPLQERGFDVTGLDLSAGMLSRAKAKGVAKLVMAEASTPPFRKKTFDAVIVAHTLQLLKDPARAFDSLAGVAKKEINVFLRKPAPRHDGANEAREEVYRAFRTAARELGVSLGARYGRWRERYAKQDEFLAEFPPDERITIQEADYSDSLREYLSAMNPCGCSYTAGISDEEFHRVVERVKLAIDLDRKVPYHRVDQMLIWRLR